MQELLDSPAFLISVTIFIQNVHRVNAYVEENGMESTAIVSKLQKISKNDRFRQDEIEPYPVEKPVESVHNCLNIS